MVNHYRTSASIGRTTFPPATTYTSVTEKISALVLTRPTGLGWLGCFGFSHVLVFVFLVAVAYLLFVGVGIWGIQIPNAWGFAITDFVWWIGIGHAGTLISAFLLLDAPEMADLDQPHRRGHDDLRRDVRGDVSPLAPGPARGSSTG